MSDHNFHMSTIDSKNSWKILADGYRDTDISRSAEAAMDELYSNGFQVLMNACKSNKAFIKQVHNSANDILTVIIHHTVNVGEYAVIPLYHEYEDQASVADALDQLMNVMKDEHGSDYKNGYIYLYPLEDFGEKVIHDRLLELGYLSTGTAHKRESFVKDDMKRKF